MLSFSSTCGGPACTGLAARLPPPLLLLFPRQSIGDIEDAAVAHPPLPPLFLDGDGDVVTELLLATTKDGKRSDGGRSEREGGVLGLEGRACLRRLCFVVVVIIMSAAVEEVDS